MEQSSLQKLCDEELAARYQAGNNAALVELVARYIDLSDKKIGRYPHLLKEAEDVKQEALITLVQAVSHYRSDKGASFATYLNRCTDHKIANILLHLSAKKIQQLQQAVPLEEAEQFALSEQGQTPETLLIERENYEVLLQLIEKRLSQFERSVLFCFLDGKSYQEIATQLQSDEKAVDNALQRVRKKLKATLG